MKRKNLSIALFIAMFGLTAQAQQAMHVTFDEHARMNRPDGSDQDTRELQHRLFEQQVDGMPAELQEHAQKQAPKHAANAEDNPLLLDSYIQYNADGSYSSKRVYNYNENGSQRMFVHYDWKDGEWVTSSKDEYSYDGNGNRTMRASYEWQDGEWVTSSKDEYSYDENGNQILDAYYNGWQDGEWVGSYKFEYSYDENGNQIMYAYYNGWQDGEWVGSSKYEFSYDEYGNKTMSASYNWQDGEWVGSSKYEYSYDENGNQIMYAYYNGWQDGEWVGYYKSEDAYDEHGNQTMSAFYRDWKDGEWVGYSKYEYTYDEYGNEIMLVCYDWNGGKWVRDHSLSYIVDNDVDYLGNLISTIKYYSGGSPYEKYEYAYDENGNRTMRARYYWKDGEWVGSYKYEYTYDEYGNKILDASYNWKDGEWVGSYKYEYSYDEYGNKTLNTSYNWQDGEWVGSHKYEYSYDEYGNETLNASYNWKDGEWVGSFKSEDAYDENGNKILDAYYNGWQDSEWVGAYKYEYTYDEYGNKTLNARYYWQDGEWVGSYKYESSYDEYGNETMSAYYNKWQDGEWMESYYTIYYYSDHSSNTPLVAESTLQIAPIATVANDDVNSTDKMLQFSIAGTPTKYNEIEADIYFHEALDPRTSSDIVMGEGLPCTPGEGESKIYSHKIDFTEASAEKQDMPGYVRHHLHISSTDSKQFTDNNLFSIYCGTKNVEDNFYPVILRNITLSNDGLDNATTPLESSYVKIGNPAKGTLALQGYIPEIVTNALETETAIKSLDLTSVTAISGDFTYMVGRNVVAPASVDASVKFIAPLAGSYSSFCAPVEVEIPCYTFSKIENGLAYFTEATYAPANEAVIINTAVNTSAQSMTLLSVAGKEVTSGYYVSNNGTEFHSVNGKAVIPALRGCFELPATSNLRIAIETPTGIEVIGSAAEVFGNAYDLQGRQINHAKNGLYVVNGKKMLVK